MKLFIYGAWVSASAFSSTVAWLVGLTDWSLFGWAFLGATAFVAYERTQTPPVARTMSQYALVVGIGIVVAMATNTWVAQKTGLPIVLVTAGLGAGGYKLFGLFQKRVEKPSDVIDDLNKLPKS